MHVEHFWTMVVAEVQAAWGRGSLGWGLVAVSWCCVTTISLMYKLSLSVVWSRLGSAGRPALSGHLGLGLLHVLLIPRGPAA